MIVARLPLWTVIPYRLTHGLSRIGARAERTLRRRRADFSPTGHE